MKAVVLVLILCALVAACATKTQEDILFYSPGINNHDADATWWPSGGYLPPDLVARWVENSLRRQYTSQTNHFHGSVVLHRYIGTNHTISLYRSMVCDSSSNFYQVGYGYEMSNATNMATFEEVLAEVLRSVEKDVSNNKLNPTKEPASGGSI